MVNVRLGLTLCVVVLIVLHIRHGLCTYVLVYASSHSWSIKPTPRKLDRHLGFAILIATHKEDENARIRTYRNNTNRST